MESEADRQPAFAVGHKIPRVLLVLGVMHSPVPLSDRIVRVRAGDTAGLNGRHRLSAVSPIRRQGVRRARLSAVSEQPRAEDVVRAFMAAFTEAWPTGDAATLAGFFSLDAEYCNGPSEPVRGREAIIAEFGRQMGMGGEVDTDVRHFVADGPVVMIERVDYVRLGEKTAGVRIAGVFEVHGGVITGWRDYFDPNEFRSQLLTG